MDTSIICLMLNSLKNHFTWLWYRIWYHWADKRVFRRIDAHEEVQCNRREVNRSIDTYKYIYGHLAPFNIIIVCLASLCVGVCVCANNNIYSLKPINESIKLSSRYNFVVFGANAFGIYLNYLHMADRYR